MSIWKIKSENILIFRGEGFSWVFHFLFSVHLFLVAAAHSWARARYSLLLTFHSVPCCLRPFPCILLPFVLWKVSGVQFKSRGFRYLDSVCWFAGSARFGLGWGLLASWWDSESSPSSWPVQVQSIALLLLACRITHWRHRFRLRYFRFCFQAPQFSVPTSAKPQRHSLLSASTPFVCISWVVHLLACFIAPGSRPLTFLRQFSHMSRQRMQIVPLAWMSFHW